MFFHNFDMLSRFRFKSCFSCFGIFHNFPHYAMFFYLSRVSVDKIDEALCMQNLRWMKKTDGNLFIALDCLLSSPSHHHFIIACLSSFPHSTMKLLLTYPVEMSSNEWRERGEIRWGNASDADGTLKLTQLFQFIDTYSRDKRWAHDRQPRVRVFWVFCRHSHESADLNHQRQACSRHFVSSSQQLYEAPSVLSRYPVCW